MVGPSLEIRNAGKIFSMGDGRLVHALDGFSLSVPANGVIALMGPNGSGKTTLLRAIDRSIKLDSGEIAGISRDDEDTVSPYRIAHISQDPGHRTFSQLSIAEHFMLAEIQGCHARPFHLGVNKYRLKKFIEFLEYYGRDDLIPFLESSLDKLSGGMRQAVSILASAIPPSSDDTFGLLLLLDEPTASLDNSNERKCIELINKLHSEGATILLVTHNPYLAAEIADTIIFMHRGKNYHELRKDGTNISDGGSLHERIARVMREIFGLPDMFSSGEN
ncbi:MAG: ATP-binding cassette domain-containing protein [Acidobacteriota bacterium]|nr:ATP-binding cassette domain-containing protein [Acidobacteriota bacterium]